MNSAISEIDVLKKVIEAIEPLDDAARLRVLNYAANVFKSSTSITAVTKIDTGASIQMESKGKPAGPQEYLRRYNYKSMTKRIAVVAVFLERERGVARVDFQTLLKEFKDAKDPKLPVHVQFARAVQMNYLAKDGDLYYTTSSAEALVDKYKAGIEDETE
jgi:hypothetical protein